MDIKFNEVVKGDDSGVTYTLEVTGMSKGKLSCLMNAFHAYNSTVGNEWTSQLWKALEKAQIDL